MKPQEAINMKTRPILLITLLLTLLTACGPVTPQPIIPPTANVTVTPPVATLEVNEQTPEANFGSPTPELISLPVMTPITRLGKGAASSLALSADGKLLAVNTPLGIYVYETKTQKEIWFLLLNNNYRRMLDFSPDGKRLSIGWENGGVLVVSADTGKKLYHITTKESVQADWSPDGTRLLIDANCGEVRVWDANSGTLLHTVREAKCFGGYYFVRADWSWDGQRIYGNSGYGLMLEWDALTFQPLADYQLDQSNSSFWEGEIASSPTQSLLALVNGLDIAVMDGMTGEIVKLLKGNRQDIRLEGIAWSPDGKQLASGNFYEVIVWDVNSSQQVYNIAGYQPLPGFGWMPDGKTLVGLFSTDGSLNAVDLVSNEKLFSLDGFGATGAFSTYPRWDGSELLTYDGTNIVRWDSITGKVINRSVAPPPPYWSPRYGGDQALSPDGNRVALGEVVVDADTGQELAALKDAASHMRDKVAWSPDGRLVVSDGTLQAADTIVWDAQTGEVLLSLDNPHSYLGALTWSADGKQIAGGGDGFISIWDSQTGQEIQQFTANIQSERIQSLAWSSDGHWLASGTSSGRIVLWDMVTNQPVASLEGHADLVNKLIWSDDSSLLASSSSDGTVLIWKLP